MTESNWWMIEQENRARLRARLAEADCDRLARQARGPSRPVRAQLASALRAIANRLDASRPIGERRLAA